MNPVTTLLALFEFLLTALLALAVVYVNYRLFIATNRDYDAEVEMKKDNLGAAALLAGMLVGGGLIVREGIVPVASLVRLYVSAPLPYLNAWQVAGLVAGHLGLVFVVAIYTISLSLRFWGWLTPHIDEGAELGRGNISVGMVLGAVVLMVSLFVSDGVSRLTKSLVPQPSMGHVQIER
ncbi:MAG TPA: DUF350 domain-containing protein [Candidatus Binatia bacterium]|nr:DUF350 domain-containing protein [Candidatus Binatia bacterium]